MIRAVRAIVGIGSRVITIRIVRSPRMIVVVSSPVHDCLIDLRVAVEDDVATSTTSAHPSLTAYPPQPLTRPMPSPPIAPPIAMPVPKKTPPGTTGTGGGT